MSPRARPATPPSPSLPLPHVPVGLAYPNLSLSLLVRCHSDLRCPLVLILPAACLIYYLHTGISFFLSFCLSLVVFELCIVPLHYLREPAMRAAVSTYQLTRAGGALRLVYRFFPPMCNTSIVDEIGNQLASSSMIRGISSRCLFLFTIVA